MLTATKKLSSASKYNSSDTSRTLLCAIMKDSIPENELNKNFNYDHILCNIFTSTLLPSTGIEFETMSGLVLEMDDGEHTEIHFDFYPNDTVWIV